MFEGRDFPKPLDEELFEDWLENGRHAKRGYKYLLVVWDEYESTYRPLYTEHRDEIEKYERYKAAVGRESLVAAYDLYSESKIT